VQQQEGCTATGRLYNRKALKQQEGRKTIGKPQNSRPYSNKKNVNNWKTLQQQEGCKTAAELHGDFFNLNVLDQRR
jgi:hypothetical protein